MASRSGASRRKPQKTWQVKLGGKNRKVSDDEDEDMEQDSSGEENRNGNAKDDEMPELPEGTVIVNPEPVDDSSRSNSPAPSGRKGSQPLDSSTLLDRITCTSCGKQVNPNNSGALRRHKRLKVLQCKKCYKYLKSGEITQDEDGLDEQCCWCGEGGRLYGCDFCHHTFCRCCIMRNFGRSEIGKLDSDTGKWKCYVCSPMKLASKVDRCNKVLDLIDKMEKKQREREKAAKEKAKKAEKGKKEEPNRSRSTTPHEKPRVTLRAPIKVGTPQAKKEVFPEKADKKVLPANPIVIADTPPQKPAPIAIKPKPIVVTTANKAMFLQTGSVLTQNVNQPISLSINPQKQKTMQSLLQQQLLQPNRTASAQPNLTGLTNDTAALKKAINPGNVSTLVNKLTSVSSSLSLMLRAINTDLEIAQLERRDPLVAKGAACGALSSGMDIMFNAIREIFGVAISTSSKREALENGDAVKGEPVDSSTPAAARSKKVTSDGLDVSCIPITIDDSDSEEQLPAGQPAEEGAVVEDVKPVVKTEDTGEASATEREQENGSIKGDNLVDTVEDGGDNSDDDDNGEMMAVDEDVSDDSRDASAKGAAVADGSEVAKDSDLGVSCDKVDSEDNTSSVSTGLKDKPLPLTPHKENAAAQLELLKELADELAGVNDQESKMSGKEENENLGEKKKIKDESETEEQETKRTRKTSKDSENKKSRSSTVESESEDEERNSKKKKAKKMLKDTSSEKDGKKGSVDGSDSEDSRLHTKQKDKKVSRGSKVGSKKKSLVEEGESDDDEEEDIKKTRSKRLSKDSEKSKKRKGKDEESGKSEDDETDSKTKKDKKFKSHEKGKKVQQSESDDEEIESKAKKGKTSKEVKSGRKDKSMDNSDDDFQEEKRRKKMSNSAEKSKKGKSAKLDDTNEDEKSKEKEKKSTAAKDDKESSDSEDSDDTDSSEEAVHTKRRSSRKKGTEAGEKKKQSKGTGKKSKKEGSESENFDSDLEQEISKLSRKTRLRKTKSGVKEDAEKSSKHSESELEKEDKKGKKRGPNKKKEEEESLSSGTDVPDAQEEEDEEEDESCDDVNLSERLKKAKEATEKSKKAVEEEEDEEELDESMDEDEELENSDPEVSFPKLQTPKKGKMKIVSEEESDSDVGPAKKKRLRGKLLDAKLSEDSSGSDVQTPKKKRKGKKKESTSEESDSDFHTPKKGKGKGKGKQKRKHSSSEESESNEDSDESSEDGKKKKKKGKGKKSYEKTKGKKRRRIRRMKESSEEDEKEPGEDDDLSSDDEDGTPGGYLKRKKIRKVMKDKKLTDETKKARKAEEERRKRIEERQKEYNSYMEVIDGEEEEEEEKPPEGEERQEDEDAVKKLLGSPKKIPITTKLVLEMDKEKKKELVKVNSTLIKKLKPHQVDAVRFMYNSLVENLERLKKEEGSGCILAHCMGLGKTLSVISFLHTMMSNHKKTKITKGLVVCPLNTVLNWVNEFSMWLQDVDFDIEVFEMSRVKQNFERAQMLKDWHQGSGAGVLILGYDMYRNLTLGSHCKNKKQKQVFYETLCDPGPDIVVCDEGHILKNDATSLSKAMNKMVTKRRIVLTGTPLQNNLGEYHCMVSFVKPNLLGTRKEFNNRFNNPITNGQCADSTLTDVKVMKRRAHILHEMLAGCVQRKDYSALTKFLPPKFEYVISVRLAPIQMTLYEKYLEKGGLTQQGNEIRTKGARLFADYQALMRIWTHPWVLKLDEIRQQNKMRYDDDDEDSFIDDSGNDSEDSFVTSKSSNSEVSAIELDSDGSDTGAGRRRSRRSRRRKSSSSSSSNSDGEKKPKNEIVKKWTTKSRRGDDEDGAGPSWAADVITVEDDPTPSGEWWGQYVKDEDNKKLELGGKLMLLFEILKMCEEIGDKVLVFSQSLLSLDIIEDFLEKVDQAHQDAGPRNAEQDGEKKAENEDGEKKAETGDGEKKAENVDGEKKAENGDGEKKAENEDGSGDKNKENTEKGDTCKPAEASGSADKTNETGQPEEEKKEDPLLRYRSSWSKGADYFRMDGSTNPQTRQASQDRFNDEENYRARLFLISTKAGSLGINLVAANRVIIFDASWNPSHDIQSIFRVYRFGQTKPVYVYRFLAQGTMEEKIYERQVTKQSLSQRVVDEHQIERHFTSSDLQELYKFNPDRLDDPNRKENLPMLPKDHMLAELMTNHKEWIVTFHEHDSLLENLTEETLSEEDRKAAWEEYENEKKGIFMNRVQPMMSMINNQGFAQNMYGGNMNMGGMMRAPMGMGGMMQGMPGVQGIPGIQGLGQQGVLQIVQDLKMRFPNLPPDVFQQRVQAVLRQVITNQIMQQNAMQRNVERRQMEELQRLNALKAQIQQQQVQVEAQQRGLGINARFNPANAHNSTAHNSTASLMQQLEGARRAPQGAQGFQKKT